MTMRDRLLGGIAGGILGGIVFALVLQGAGLIASVGTLVGEAGVALGWATLLVITAALGLVYGLTFGRLPHTWLHGPIYGLAHGLVWWLIGVVLILPLWAGYPIGTFGEATWFNLLGYALYGLVTGVVTTLVAQQATTVTPEPEVEHPREPETSGS